MITEETIIELNDQNEVVVKEEIKGTIETRKRFRLKDVDKYTNLRFATEDVLVELHKCRQKKDFNPQLNIKTLIRIRTINVLVNKAGKDIFYLLKTSDRLSLVFEILGAKIKAKAFLPESIHVGYTSNLSFLGAEREAAQNHLDKMTYLIPLEEEEELNINSTGVVYEVFVLIPKARVIINLQMVGFKFLNNQEISTL